MEDQERGDVEGGEALPEIEPVFQVRVVADVGLAAEEDPDAIDGVEDDGDEDVDTSLARKFTHELTREELTAIAFQHEALRARPPILWLPDDELGIARDEIRHTKLECGDEIEITCKGAILDNKGKIVWSQNPPDYAYIPIL